MRFVNPAGLRHMNAEQIIIDSALAFWKATVDRATKLIDDLWDEDTAEPVAPGSNRVVYVLGHLTAVHHRMLPLLGLGERVHPEMDVSVVTNPDRAIDDLPPLAGPQGPRGECERSPSRSHATGSLTFAVGATAHLGLREGLSDQSDKESIECSSQQGQPPVISLRSDCSASNTLERIAGSQTNKGLIGIRRTVIKQLKVP